MSEVAQTGWTRIFTRTGRYEYQFQGRSPTVRNGQYEEAADFQFLVMDEERWLYKIPVRMAAAALEEINNAQEAGSLSAPNPPASPSERSPASASPAQVAARIAEAQLRAGLEEFRPRQNTPYAELDSYFAVDAERARQLSRR
jgi:hypothetical protein